jgi:hypothetical protein
MAIPLISRMLQEIIWMQNFVMASLVVVGGVA